MITVNGIKLLPDTKVSYAPNPKRRGSMACDRYEKYCKAKTVEDYFRICKDHSHGLYTRRDLRYDYEKVSLRL